MFLLTFDIINSKKQNLELKDIPTLNNYLNALNKEFEIGNNNIELFDNNKLRFLLQDHTNLMEIIFVTLSFIVLHDLKAHVYITQGIISSEEYSKLSDASGNIFQKNEELENKTKKDKIYYNKELCSIRYKGYSKKSIIDTLFLCITKICLSKDKNIPVLYEYIFKGFTQKELANRFSISQVGISKKLKSNDSKMLIKLINEINILIGEDTNN